MKTEQSNDVGSKEFRLTLLETFCGIAVAWVVYDSMRSTSSLGELSSNIMFLLPSLMGVMAFAVANYSRRLNALEKRLDNYLDDNNNSRTTAISRK